jgi:TetR/AcrR family transcriptional regulator, mexJK operon transcriptional repressor
MAGTTIRKGRPTAEDSRQKLAQILDVARDLFAERGYRAVTMREVAERANVSTRTLYNRYADKFSLFNACLDFGASAFPPPPAPNAEALQQALTAYGVQIVKVLATDSSVRLSMLIYRESNEFPELLKASEDNHRIHLLAPLTLFLKKSGFPAESAEEFAKLYLALALSEWQRRMTYNHPLPSPKEIEAHAARAAAMFVAGAPAAQAKTRADRKEKVAILAAHRRPERTKP